MKIKIKIKECQLIVKVKTSAGEEIDGNQFDIFSRAYFRGFLKPRYIKYNTIEYTGPIGINLYGRLRKPISKRDFLFIIEQIVIAIQKLKANNLHIKNLVMNIHQVFVNEVTKELQFLYVPLRNTGNNTNLIEFMESIIYSMIPIDDNDRNFISRFTYFFKSMSVFDINKIEEFIKREDMTVVNALKKQNAGYSNFITDKRQHYYEHYDKKENFVNPKKITKPAENNMDEVTGLLEDDSQGFTGSKNKYVRTAFPESEQTALLTPEGADETTALDEIDNGDEGTMLLNENENSVRYPTLIRCLTGDRICINKPVYRIGKERSYVDYYVTNNPAVSRSHADIIKRGKKYFVKDLNSKNHTYINEQEIPVDYEIEICNGDKLKLGNEEFIFYIN